MLKYLLAALMFILASPQLCSAQPYLQQASEDSSGAVTTMGSPHDTLASMALEMNLTKRVRDNCWNLGCLVIVNETHGYDVIGFYVNMAGAAPEPKWSRNQFDHSALYPSKATIRFKTGGPDACNIPVRFVLRSQATKEKVDLQGNANLCTTPHEDSLIRVKVFEPKVIVEDPDHPENNPPPSN